MTMQTLALFVLVALAIGGVAWVFIYPILSGERKAEKRQRERRARGAGRARAAAATPPEVAPRAGRGDAEGARASAARSRRACRLPMRIAQAGLTWSKRQFIMIVGAASAWSLFVAGLHGRRRPAAGARRRLCRRLRPAALAAVVPQEAPRDEVPRTIFPTRVDVIVRGIKAGLPLLDCLRIIAHEAPEPVKSEFRTIVETQPIGMPLGEACAKLYERMPLPEANFFAIVIVDPAEGRRQPVRGARQPVARAARPQEDEGQDPGDVDGGKASAVIIGCAAARGR